MSQRSARVTAMNYCDNLLKNVERWPDKRVATELDTGRTVTFSQLLRRVRQVAAALIADGISPQEQRRDPSL
ncbi:MAG: hypothetical protein QM784_29650 [Polyangiaceae bacterium]